MGSTMYLDADDILVISKVYNLILRCKRSQDKGDVILSFFYKVSQKQFGHCPTTPIYQHIL